MYDVQFGLTDFADVLYSWALELSDFWNYIVNTSAHDFLVDIEGKLFISVVGSPVALILSAYVNFVNLFNDGYLVRTSMLEWMLGGMLQVFVSITVISWIHDRLYRVGSPLE